MSSFLQTVAMCKEDKYRGVVVTIVDGTSIDANQYSKMLSDALQQWRKEKKHGVWIHIPTTSSSLFDATVKLKFRPHSCSPASITLNCWLPQGIKNTLPPAGSFTVGVACCVVNKTAILVVQERFGSFSGTQYWKLVTGRVDKGEDVSAAACREVKEETGIDAEFDKVLLTRHSQEEENIMYLVALIPRSVAINIQESEIAGAKWMEIAEYVAQERHQRKGKEDFKKAAEICRGYALGSYSGINYRPFGDGQASLAYVEDKVGRLTFPRRTILFTLAGFCCLAAIIVSVIS